VSFFASQTSATIPIPFDPPHTVTIRKMTGREVELAQAVHAGEIASGRGWAERFRRVLVQGIKDGAAAQVLADPLNGYDRRTVIASGLLAWSYETPKTLETLADLEDEAAEFVAHAILKLTKPALFQTADEAEADRKNG
jgi:predicted butyrate kinase (DUF1464 family)